MWGKIVNKKEKLDVIFDKAIGEQIKNLSDSQLEIVNSIVTMERYKRGLDKVD